MDPRFRRWLGFNYVPCNGAGWLTFAALFAIEIPIGIASLAVEPKSLSWWLLAVTGFAISLAFLAFIHMRTEFH